MSNDEKEQQEGAEQDSTQVDNAENLSKDEKKESNDVKTVTVESTNSDNIQSLDQSSIIKDDKSTFDKTTESVSFKVVFNKQKYDVQVPLDYTIKQLKEHLSTIINVLPAMQKVMIKGLAKDEKTLRDLDVTVGSKIMVVGSKLDDVVNVNTPKAETKSSEASSSGSTSKEPMSQQKLHKKIIDKGIPEDALPGIKDCKLALPSSPLSGMINKRGGKVRLTFKLEVDQVWIGTKDRTEKINMNHIRQVVSEPIQGNEQYHILGLQLGPTDASRYWVYWVPAQYVDAIKDTVLGKWQ